MAICHYCKNAIGEVRSCELRTLHRLDGKLFTRITFGSERQATGRQDKEARCPNCKVGVGMIHHAGCVTEECPRCHRQLLSCRCPLMVGPSSVGVLGASPREPVRAAPGAERAGLPPRRPLELPTWHPTYEQQRDSLAALRLGQRAGCWKRDDCRLTLRGGFVEQTCAGQTERITFTNEDEVIARLRERHARAAGRAQSERRTSGE